MDEKPKSIWKKSFTGRVALFLLSIAATATVFLVLVIYGLVNWSGTISEVFTKICINTLICFFVCLVAIFFIWPLLRLMFWKHWRRTLFGLACLVTMVALFYAEEDWRGKRAWNNYVRACEAAGASMDWRTYIPAQIPDDQNLAMCPLFKPVLDYTKTNDPGHASTIWNDTNGTARVYRLDVRWPDGWSIGRDSDAHGAARKELDATPLTNGWVNLAAWQNYFRTGTNLAGIPAGKTPAEDVLLGMRFMEPDMAELQGEAARRPLGRWPLHYDTDFLAGILLPQLGDIRRINKTLKVRAAARLAAGDVAGGLADVQLGLRLADSAACESLVISLLVREFAVEDI